MEQDTGSATVTASNGTAPYSYSWAPSGGTAATATGLVAGIYTITVTDANACQQTATVNITQPTALVASISAQTNVLCNGASTGSATVTASNGTAPYSYSWAPSGGKVATASGLAAGTYTV
ncbi:SprB repeat-containing protein, partial [Lacihabitans soyangensis]|uniref:SprB repeat-containing protein n=1 Tax=Lacihabitans soyangensis TaxID=869394 RepID=UPI0020CE2280